tara:strand:+ start:8984 stop:10606 length:1623 start_codon:yes stop_codon:yes gene_type:complete
MENLKVKDLFDESNPKVAAERHEDYLGALSKSLSSPKSFINGEMGGDATSEMEKLVANKSLSPDALNSLQTALAQQRGAMGDINKEITLTNPLSSSFAAFDLEAPAKMLTPRPTPLRNKIPRKKGIGTSRRVKRITAYTGTGTGVGNLWPGITETTQNNFAPGADTPFQLERGPQISYIADDLVLPYNSYSLSDQVSFDANFSGMGYQDLRQLSSTSTLYATMLMEERMMLYARGTASPYSGALAAPTVTLTKRSAGAGETALPNDEYFVYVTSNAGSFGQSVVSALDSDTTSSQVIELTWPAVEGAIGYNVYVGLTTGRANAHFCGTTSTLTFVLDASNFSTTGAIAPAADTSAYATGYDGIVPTVLGANTGYNNNINTTFSTGNPGVEYQTVFYNLYNNVKADPDEILINGADRKQLSDAIKNGSTANYRLNLTQTETGDYVGGATIGALNNEITGKMVPLTVHPWLQQGVSPVLSYTLPIPDTEVSDVWAAINVQDYMGIQWPVVQFTYDFSTYFRGTFFCYAPAWNGAVSGIKNVA